MECLQWKWAKRMWFCKLNTAFQSPHDLTGWRAVYSCRRWDRNAILNTNHFNHLSYLLHFSLLGFPLSKQIFCYLIMHLTDVQINLGIFTKALVSLWSHLTPPPTPTSSSNQFNSKLQISWSILSRSLWKSPSSILHNFSCPLSLQIHCEIAYSGY